MNMVLFNSQEKGENTMKIPSLMPREDKFYRLLEQLTAEAAISAQNLKELITASQPAQKQDAGQSIALSKGRAKQISADVTVELCRSFVTPYDREDIEAFSNHLYKIPKTIEKIKERLDLYGLEKDLTSFERQTDLIVAESKALEDLVNALTARKKSQDLIAKVARLKELETEGDRVLNELLAELFRESRDPRDLILQKDLYDMLEKVIDRFRNVGSIVLQIVLKYS